MRLRVVVLILALCPLAHSASYVLTTNATVCPQASNNTGLVVKLPQDKGGASLTVSGTWTGTISFYMTGDGGSTWVAALAMPVGVTTAVTTTTGNGLWQVSTTGISGVCMLSSATMTGAATATITPSAAPFAR